MLKSIGQYNGWTPGLTVVCSLFCGYDKWILTKYCVTRKRPRPLDGVVAAAASRTLTSKSLPVLV